MATKVRMYQARVNNAREAWHIIVPADSFDDLHIRYDQPNLNVPIDKITYLGFFDVEIGGDTSSLNFSMPALNKYYTDDNYLEYNYLSQYFAKDIVRYMQFLRDAHSQY